MTSWSDTGGRAWISHGCQFCPVSDPRKESKTAQWDAHGRGMTACSGPRGFRKRKSSSCPSSRVMEWKSTGCQSQLTLTQNLLLFVSLWISPHKTANLEDMGCHWYDGWIQRREEEGSEKATNKVNLSLQHHTFWNTAFSAFRSLDGSKMGEQKGKKNNSTLSCFKFTALFWVNSPQLWKIPATGGDHILSYIRFAIGGNAEESQ